MSEYKTTCPRCGGEVRIVSIRCKHCDELTGIDVEAARRKLERRKGDNIPETDAKEGDLKRGLIIATVATVSCTIISCILSISVYQLEKNIVNVLAMMLLFCIPFLVFSTWNNYSEGNFHLAIKSRNAMLIISIIPLVSMLCISFLLMLYFLGPY